MNKFLGTVGGGKIFFSPETIAPRNTTKHAVGLNGAPRGKTEYGSFNTTKLKAKRQEKHFWTLGGQEAAYRNIGTSERPWYLTTTIESPAGSVRNYTRPSASMTADCFFLFIHRDGTNTK